MNDKTKDPDWQQIAMELKTRLIFAVSYGKFGSGLMLDEKTMETQNVKEWMADALEMFPGVTVNRELMHMTPAQRIKAKKKELQVKGSNNE